MFQRIYGFINCAVAFADVLIVFLTGWIILFDCLFALRQCFIDMRWLVVGFITFALLLARVLIALHMGGSADRFITDLRIRLRLSAM
jgi:hypothetical protein